MVKTPFMSEWPCSPRTLGRELYTATRTLFRSIESQSLYRGGGRARNLSKLWSPIGGKVRNFFRSHGLYRGRRSEFSQLSERMGESSEFFQVPESISYLERTIFYDSRLASLDVSLFHPESIKTESSEFFQFSWSIYKERVIFYDSHLASLDDSLFQVPESIYGGRAYIFLNFSYIFRTYFFMFFHIFYIFLHISNFISSYFFILNKERKKNASLEGDESGRIVFLR